MNNLITLQYLKVMVFTKYLLLGMVLKRKAKNLYQMSTSGNRRIEYHARACPAHNLTNLLAHLGSVTMNGTVFTCGLLLAKLTPLQSFTGIIVQLPVRFGHLVEG